jgi:hypothetical protein
MSFCEHENTCPDRAILPTAYPCFCCEKRDMPIHEFMPFVPATVTYPIQPQHPAPIRKCETCDLNSNCADYIHGHTVRMDACDFNKPAPIQTNYERELEKITLETIAQYIINNSGTHYKCRHCAEKYPECCQKGIRCMDGIRAWLNKPVEG